MPHSLCIPCSTTIQCGNESLKLALSLRNRKDIRHQTLEKALVDKGLLESELKDIQQAMQLLEQPEGAESVKFQV